MIIVKPERLNDLIEVIQPMSVLLFKPQWSGSTAYTF